MIVSFEMDPPVHDDAPDRQCVTNVSTQYAGAPIAAVVPAAGNGYLPAIASVSRGVIVGRSRFGSTDEVAEYLRLAYDDHVMVDAPTFAALADVPLLALA